MGTPNPAATAVATKVEQTMRRMKVWAVPAPPLKPFHQPFAMDAMPFEHWIQLVLVPRLHEVGRGDQPMPPSSNLAAHAVREFDGMDEMNPLIDVLHEVDALSKPFRMPVPAAGVPSMFTLRLVGKVALVVGVIFSIYVSQWVSRSLSVYFPAHVSAVFFGSVRPDMQHSVLRIGLMSERREEGRLRPTRVSVMLNSSRMPTPGVLMTVPEPLSFDAATPPNAAAIRDWMLGAGVDANSAGVLPAAEEVLDVLAVAMSARTRPELEALRPRLPAGTPEPQIVDIDGHTPTWLDLTVAIVAAVVFCLPFLGYALRVRRRRQAQA